MSASRAATLALTIGALLTSGCVEGPRALKPPEPRETAFDPTRWAPGPPPAATRAPPPSLKFGITPFYSPERQRPMLRRLEAYLEKHLALDITPLVAPTYADCVAQLKAGELHAAQLSPYAYVRALEEIDDLEVLATAVAQGTSTYASYLVVARSSPIESIHDAKGKRLGFTDPWSTSGYVYPKSWLEKRGFDVERDFEVQWLSQHDAGLDALLRGDVDILAVSSDTLVSARAIGIAGPVRIVAKTGRIPYDAIVTRTSVLDDNLRHRLRAAVLKLSIHTPEGQEVLEDYNLINGFMPVPDDHYDEVRERARPTP